MCFSIQIMVLLKILFLVVDMTKNVNGTTKPKLVTNIFCEFARAIISLGKALKNIS